MNSSVLSLGIVVTAVLAAVVCLTLLISGCARIEGVYATYPQGSVLCSKDPDCLEGQYCGFVPGYSAAVCRGQATGVGRNLN